jgi:hypothetical protein
VREEDVEVVIMRYDMTLRDYEPAISPLPSFASSSDQANPKKWITPDFIETRRSAVVSPSDHQRDQRQAGQRGSIVSFALSPVHARTNAIVGSRGQM